MSKTLPESGLQAQSNTDMRLEIPQQSRKVVLCNQAMGTLITAEPEPTDS